MTSKAEVEAGVAMAEAGVAIAGKSSLKEDDDDDGIAGSVVKSVTSIKKQS